MSAKVFFLFTLSAVVASIIVNKYFTPPTAIQLSPPQSSPTTGAGANANLPTMLGAPIFHGGAFPQTEAAFNVDPSVSMGAAYGAYEGKSGNEVIVTA